jgi:hypothetical protein
VERVNSNPRAQFQDTRGAQSSFSESMLHIAGQFAIVPVSGLLMAQQPAARTDGTGGTNHGIGSGSASTLI